MRKVVFYMSLWKSKIFWVQFTSTNVIGLLMMWLVNTLLIHNWYITLGLVVLTCIYAYTRNERKRKNQKKIDALIKFHNIK